MKRSPVVRPARGFDVDEIAAVARRPFAARWSRDAYAAEAERVDSVFLVADDGKVRGYALARLFDGEAQLLDIAVDEDGKGVGRSLLAAVIVAARGRGAQKLTLEVSDANSRARLFYARAGAKVVGRRAKFYNDGSDALLMDLRLA